MEVYKGMLCPAKKQQKLKNNFGIIGIHKCTAFPPNLSIT